MSLNKLIESCERLINQLPHCGGEWISGSGGHRVHYGLCGKVAFWNDDPYYYCDEHCPNPKIHEAIEKIDWADAIKELQEEIRQYKYDSFVAEEQWNKMLESEEDYKKRSLAAINQENDNWKFSDDFEDSPIMKKHPMQPVELCDGGIVRFKENKIITFMLDAGTNAKFFDLNIIAEMGFSAEDRMQLAQLIGYSISGYADLSYVSDESYEEAKIQVQKLENEE